MASKLQLTRRQALELTRAKPPTGPAPKAKRAPRVRQPRFGKRPPQWLEATDQRTRVQLWITLTNNNHGRGHSYHQSDQFRKECELQLRAWGLACDSIKFEYPVEINVVRVLGPRQKLWDSSSGLRGNWKEIEDSLVAIGWFADDSPQWIRRTTFDQVSTDRANGPSIIIEITRV